MTPTLQVIYPIADGTTFDMGYYLDKHMAIVGEHMGPHIASTLVTKGLAGGPNTPPGIHAIASIVFKDQAAMDAAMAASGPVIADIANFTNAQPQMLIGEVIG